MIRGVRGDADAIVLAPVFATASHPTARALGPTRFAALVRKVSRPVIALGGVNTHTARRLTHSGARGLAGIGWSAEV
jgi:thiamine-phosphate pyrophosphorylase